MPTLTQLRSTPDESHVLHVITPPTQKHFHGANDEGLFCCLHVGYTGRAISHRSVPSIMNEHVMQVVRHPVVGLTAGKSHGVYIPS